MINVPMLRIIPGPLIWRTTDYVLLECVMVHCWQFIALCHTLFIIDVAYVMFCRLVDSGSALVQLLDLRISLIGLRNIRVNCRNSNIIVILIFSLTIVDFELSRCDCIIWDVIIDLVIFRIGLLIMDGVV